MSLQTSVGLELVLTGKPIYHTARECGVDVRTVFRLLKRYNEENQTIPKPKPIPGRPEKATLRHIKRIKKLIKKHPFWSARAIKDSHHELEDISVDVVQRVILNKLGLRFYRAAKKPPLSDNMLAARKR